MKDLEKNPAFLDYMATYQKMYDYHRLGVPMTMELEKELVMAKLTCMASLCRHHPMPEQFFRVIDAYAVSYFSKLVPLAGLTETDMACLADYTRRIMSQCTKAPLLAATAH